MEAVKNFVVNLVTTLIFISAIELICPDNKMKKYINSYRTPLQGDCFSYLIYPN